MESHLEGRALSIVQGGGLFVIPGHIARRDQSGAVGDHEVEQRHLCDGRLLLRLCDARQRRLLGNTLGVLRPLAWHWACAQTQQPTQFP